MSLHPLFQTDIVGSNAKIILTPCPGTKDVDLITSLSQIKQAGADAVLTFMTQAELEKNKLPELGQSVKNQGMLWFHLPIIDDHAPESEFLEAWKIAGPIVHNLIAEGKTIAVHCKGGSGRTGLVSAQIMIERGEQMNSVMERLKALRPNAFVHACHREYLAELAENVSL